VEHLATAFGIDTTRPRLSWWLPVGAGRQSGYRIRTGNGWDTGHVTSDESVLVGYDGPPLGSGDRVSWQARVWTEQGESEWSEPHCFELGLQSLNHYSKGAVITFLHRHVAGIRLPDGAPGYRHFRIEPQPGGGITWAQARHDSPYGRIESAWRLDGGTFELWLTVPPGTTAEVALPDGSRHPAAPGRHTLRCPAPQP